MSSHTYLGDSESLKDLESRMVSPDRETYGSYKHLRIASAFIGRIYVIFKPTGIGVDNHHRAPEIVTQIKVIDFTANWRDGAVITLENLGTGEILRVGHIPVRLFDFDAFVACPPFQRLRWDGRMINGNVRRSLAFGILFKTRTRSDFYSAGATMVETPKGFRQLYPDTYLPLQYA